VSGFVVWFTGLSGAGKSTLGALLAAALRGRGVHVEVLDGDEVRTHLSKGLSFSREDRDTNIRRIGFVAKLVARSGACAITAAISPFRSIRDEQRTQIGRFVEVYCQSSIEALAARDPKGLYRKALAGEIKGFTGIDDPYEEPLHPEVVVYTDRETKEESLAKILGKLEELSYIASSGIRVAGQSTQLTKPHGGALVSCRVLGEQAMVLAQKAQGLSVIDLDAESEAHLELLATGAFSPLEGFLTSKDWLRVLAEMRLENGLPWPVPVSLPVSEEMAGNVRVGQEIALRARSGQIVGLIEVSDVYCPEELLRGRAIVGPFGELDPELSRQRMRGRFFLGGKVQVFARASLDAKMFTPRDIRAQWEKLGVKYVAAMFSRGALRSGEEYAARVALDVTSGLLWQLLDASDAARLAAHEALMQKAFPAKRVILSARMGTSAVGPRAAILDGILAQNFGCSHVVLGQGSGGDFRDAFALFALGELAVVPLVFTGAEW
jgi:adenylyl-sulfate kinase